MAGNREVRCVGPSNQLSDRKAGVQRAVNMYLSAVEGAGEDRQFFLKECQGITATLAVGSVSEGAAGMHSGALTLFGGCLYHFVLLGGVMQLWRLLPASLGGTDQFLGSMSGSSGPWSLAVGRDSVVATGGSSAYVYNTAASTFAQITDPDFPGATDVVNIDGYFIFCQEGSDQFFLSAIDDATTYDALDFTSADVQPDAIVTIRAHKRELHVIGEYSYEIWVNAGSADFPFVRQNSTPIDVGAVGRSAVVVTSDSVFLVGRVRGGQTFVYQMNGYTPVRVSTTAVEEALRESTALSECAMWTYNAPGAEFVGLWAPGMTTTWVYNLATRMWHELAIMGVTDWEPLKIRSAAYFDGRIMASIDIDTDQVLHALSDDYHDYEFQISGSIVSKPKVRERTWPHLVSPSFEDVRYASLELACTTGHGGNVTLEVSNDGGSTWGSPLSRSLGATGRRMERVRWHFLGAARDRVFRLRCSDDVPFNIHGAQVEAA